MCIRDSRAGAERAAINAPMQGTAADIIKRAMIAVDEWLLTEKPRVRMIMPVSYTHLLTLQRRSCFGEETNVQLDYRFIITQECGVKTEFAWRR